MTNHDGNRIDELIGQDFQIVPFRDLPFPHKMAMAWYMAVDGEAWSDVLDQVSTEDMPRFQSSAWYEFWKQVLRDEMHRFDDAHGDECFGIATIETEAMLLSIRDDDVNREEGLSLDDIKRNYASGGRHPEYPEHGPTDRWPVIISSYEDETLQDGWHRFGSYAGAGHPDVPAIFYPKERHLVMEAGPVAPRP